ncbi:MAG: 50S ribosomal protein L29 [Bryobacteraceae bacterium]
MKADKIREMDSKELGVKLHEIDEQMFHLRLQMSLGQMDGLKKYRELRKDKARILTVLRERELNAAEAK